MYVVVQSLSRVRLFVAPWTAACQAPLSYHSWGSRGKNTGVDCIFSSSGPHFVKTLHTVFTAEGAGSIPGQGTKIPQAAWCTKKNPKTTTEISPWSSAWESTCQCRGHGFNPWSGRIPHAMQRLSLSVTTTEPALESPGTTTTEARHLEPVLHNKRSHTTRSPCTSGREEPLLVTTEKDPVQPKTNN